MKISSIILLLISIGCQVKPAKEDTVVSASTARENVIILEPMLMPSLERQRSIRLYLPPGYAKSSASYPVIYAQDGQNLFDDSTAFLGEWGLDESLNQLAKETGFEAIVVGIDNGQDKRLPEYSPWENPEFGPAEGEAYIEFIINDLKPYIDSLYRTLPQSKHTVIMGSSMGGLISHYAILAHPDVFGKAIIFSPSYWYADEVWDFTMKHPLPRDAKIWLEIGANEGDSVEDVIKMYEVVVATGLPESNLVKKIDPEGEHNEASWRRQFIPAVKWLFEIDQ